MDTLADRFAVAARANAVAAKPLRLFAQNAKAIALMAEELDQPRSPLPPPRVVPACNCRGRRAG